MRLWREPLISDGETTHGRRPVRRSVRTVDTEVPWLVQPGGVVVRVCPGNAVVPQEEVAPTMRSAGHWVGDWNGGKAYGFLRERVIRHPQRGRQGEDKAPYHVATRVRSHERPNFVKSPPRSECADGLIRIRANAVRCALHGNPSRLIVFILSRNIIQTAAGFFSPFHRAMTETNLCKPWFRFSNHTDRNQKTELDTGMFRRYDDDPTFFRKVLILPFEIVELLRQLTKQAL